MKKYLPEGSKNGVYARRQGDGTLITLPYLERAMERHLMLEAPVLMCDAGMNLHVSLGACEGIIPYEEALYSPGDAPIKDIALLTRVGKPVCFYIRSIDRSMQQAPRVILSRKDAQRECYEKYIKALRPGDIVPARIAHLESFGVFLDIGCGINALLPVDAISVSRISHPRYRFSVGDEIKVVIHSIDEEGRVYVGRKELLGTWEENAALFSPGQTVAGTVRSIEPYGIFVELTPNLTGLAEYKEGVKENEVAAVYIKSIIPERMKVKLIIIDSHRALTQTQKTRFVPEPTAEHINEWRYSPACCPKIVETKFSPS